MQTSRKNDAAMVELRKQYALVVVTKASGLKSSVQVSGLRCRFSFGLNFV